MSPEFEFFAEALTPINKTEIWIAIRVLWYLENISKESDITPRRLAEVMQATGIRGGINRTRLGQNLKANPSVVAGPKVGTFRIKLSSRSALAAELEPLLAIRPQPKIEDHVIPADAFLGTRNYLEKMVLQINGCYQMGFYDGCAVLCRRIMESLLIAAFEKTSHTEAIKQGSDYLMLRARPERVERLGHS